MLNLKKIVTWFQKGPCQLRIQIYSKSHLFKCPVLWHVMDKHVEQIYNYKTFKGKDPRYYFANYVCLTIPRGCS
jgi:hypothetical protein